MSTPIRGGIVVAVLFGGLHAVWSLLVASGAGQIMCDYILWAHMIHIPVRVGPFDPVASSTLVIVTVILGYITGYVASWVWNAMCLRSSAGKI